MEDLSNKNLAKMFPKDSIWVVKTENGIRVEILYHGDNLVEARKISEENESILVRKA
ncbi:MAG: hypothetical protein JXL97_15720 [Bacteroidales bacterium]|nr:hypothetical protein [Bacteroidales bacterium]